MRNKINFEKGFKKLIRFMVLSTMLTTFIACGKATPLSSKIGSTSDLSAQIPDMSDLDGKLSAVDNQVASVDQNLANLDLQNPLNLVSDNLKNAVKKFVGITKQVKEKTAELRMKIQAQMALLDPSDAQQEKLIEKLQEAISYLDKVDAKLDAIAGTIENKVDSLFSKLENKLEEKLSGIQLILAKIVLSKVKSSIIQSLIGG